VKWFESRVQITSVSAILKIADLLSSEKKIMFALTNSLRQAPLVLEIINVLLLSGKFSISKEAYSPLLLIYGLETSNQLLIALLSMGSLRGGPVRCWENRY